MTLGNILRERDDQYVANRDQSGTWRILDTWHDDLKNIGPDDEIPDKTDAVVILSEGAFISLMKEAGRSGLLDNASGSLESNMGAPEEFNDMTEQYNEAVAKIHTLERVITDQKEQLSDNKISYSEHSHIKEKAMDTVLKLAGMDTLVSQRFNDLGKE
jgi:hypothetical protein|tara:strand:- start:1735 stop:2208 length:474 start_codon:yes stop_codon:yes gene_type:complete